MCNQRKMWPGVISSSEKEHKLLEQGVKEEWWENPTFGKNTPPPTYLTICYSLLDSEIFDAGGREGQWGRLGRSIRGAWHPLSHPSNSRTSRVELDPKWDTAPQNKKYKSMYILTMQNDVSSCDRSRNPFHLAWMPFHLHYAGGQSLTLQYWVEIAKD